MTGNTIPVLILLLSIVFAVVTQLANTVMQQPHNLEKYIKTISHHDISSTQSSYYFTYFCYNFLINVALPGGVESSGVEMAGTSILSTARYDDGLGDKIVLNFGNYTTSASFAVYTYVQPSEFNGLNSNIYQMETSRSLIALYAEEGNPSLSCPKIFGVSSLIAEYAD